MCHDLRPTRHALRLLDPAAHLRSQRLLDSLHLHVPAPVGSSERRGIVEVRTTQEHDVHGDVVGNHLDDPAELRQPVVRSLSGPRRRLHHIDELPMKRRVRAREERVGPKGPGCALDVRDAPSRLGDEQGPRPGVQRRAREQRVGTDAASCDVRQDSVLLRLRMSQRSARIISCVKRAACSRREPVAWPGSTDDRLALRPGGQLTPTFSGRFPTPHRFAPRTGSRRFDASPTTARVISIALHQCEVDAEERDAGREVARAADRVEEPVRRPVGGDFASPLFAHHRVGRRSFDDPPDLVLDGDVGLRHEIAAPFGCDLRRASPAASELESATDRTDGHAASASVAT